MFTLHLSKNMKGPPGPTMQKINAMLHQEPYSTISYGIFWFFILTVGAPLVGASLIVITLYGLFRIFAVKPRRVEPKKLAKPEGQGGTKLAVVVTGCDTGFGKELVFHLASEGFDVFAGCLTKDSFAQFKLEPLIHPLVTDVTSDDHVQECADSVNKWLEEGASANQQRYLHAIVNNAGVGKGGYIDWTTMEDYSFCMEVNCFAQIRMAKAFMSIFKKQAKEGKYKDSQILNVSSMAGLIAGGGLSMAPYEVSKNAAEAFTQALRMEMKMLNVKVIAVNPSFHATPLTDGVEDRMKKQMWPSLKPEIREEYGEEFFNNFAQHVGTMMNASSWDAKVVVDTTMAAIQSSDPPAQLIIGSDARFSLLVIRMFPQWARQLIIQLGLPPQTPAFLKENK